MVAAAAAPAARIAAPFVLRAIGWLLGKAPAIATVGVGADLALTGGEHTVGPAFKAAQDKVAPVVDEHASNLIFEHLAKPLGISREDFDGWWETVDPVAFGGTFAAVKAASFGIEKTFGFNASIELEVGIALGYHLLFTKGLMGEGLKYIQGTGVMGMDDFAPAADPAGPKAATPAPAAPAPEPAPAPGG